MPKWSTEPVELLPLEDLRGYTQANPYSVPFGAPGDGLNERALVEIIESLTPEQRQEFLRAIAPQRPGDSIRDPRFTQEMKAVEPTWNPFGENFRDTLRMSMGDFFTPIRAGETAGDHYYGRDLIKTFTGEPGGFGAIDFIPGVDIPLAYADTRRAIEQGKYGEATLIGGATLAGNLLPFAKPAIRRRKLSRQAQKAQKFAEKQDVNLNSAEFGSVGKRGVTRYGSSLENPAVRRRDQMRLEAFEELGSEQFGRGGLKVGEVGTEGAIVPITRNIIQPEDLLGRTILPVAGDTSDIRTLTKVGGVPLGSPVQVQGGPNFSVLRGGWASNQGAAANVYNTILDAAKFDPNPVGIYTGMGPEAINFSTPVVESMVGQLAAIGIPKTDLRAFDRVIRNTVVEKNNIKTKPFENFVGLESPDLIGQLRGVGGYADQSGELRKAVVAEMGKVRWRDIGFPVYSDVQSAIIRRELANQPRGFSGYSMFEGDPTAGLRVEPEHLTYDRFIPGNYIGGFGAPVSPEIMFPQTFAKLGRATSYLDQPLTEAEKLGSLAMGQHFEPVNQQWVDTVSQAIQDATPYTSGSAPGFRFPNPEAFGRGRTVRATHEQIPGAGTGHLDDITRMSPHIREDYSSTSSWVDDFGRDELYSAQGYPVERSAFGRGMYEPEGLPMETNPMTVGQPVTADMQAVRATEAARAYIDAQNAGAAHRILPRTQSTPAERVDLSVNIPGSEISQDQFLALRDVADENGYFIIDSGDQIIFKNDDQFSDIGKKRLGEMLDDSRLGETQRRAIERQVQEIVPAARLGREKVDSVYIDYQDLFKEAQKGEGLVTTALFKELNARPDVADAIDPVIKVKATANLMRDRTFAQRTGVPMREDVERALEIVGEGGWKALKAALDAGKMLPAIAAMILAPSYLGLEQAGPGQDI